MGDERQVPRRAERNQGDDGPGDGAAGKRTRTAARYASPLVQAAQDHLGARADRATIDDVATIAVERKDAGRAIDGGVAGQVGAHLGHDFSNVRVHDDPLAREATQAMGARAFAYGADVFLGPSESDRDLGLMAHELTHVAQQGASAAAMPQRAVTVGASDSPAEAQADAVAADVTSGKGKPAALIVDDGPVQPGQMLKSTFIERLRAAVTAAASEELGPIESAIGCPYIDQYFARYAPQPAAAGEGLLRRFAPATGRATTAEAMIPLVVARVREGVQQWRQTGRPPADIAAAEPAAAAAAAAAPPHAAALRAPDGRETLASLEADLGPGRPLEAGVAARMSDALGADLGAVRIHTGDRAARKAADAGARAFAAGEHVVMGAGQYNPGTLAGDALLAHELAHTVQQAGAASDPVARMAPIGAEAADAEVDADGAAVGVLARLWQGTRGVASRAVTSLRTGVQLQRCPENPAPVAPAGYSPPGSVAKGKDLLAGTGQISESEKDDIDKNILNPAGGGVGKPADPFVKTDFDKDMNAALDSWRTSILTARRKLTGPDAYKLDMPQVRKTGEAAQKAVTDKYGAYVSGAAFAAGTNARKPGYDVGSPAVLHEQKETVAGLNAADQLDVARGLVKYATNQTRGGKPVMTAHHVDRSRADDLLEYTRVVDDYAAKHTKDLIEIQATWPGEEHPWDGTVYIVYIRLENMKKPDLTKEEKAKTGGYDDANLRAGYWESFRTLIHEYLHACTHGEMVTAANSGKGNTHQILIEGGADFFTEKVWKAVEPTLAGDDALREKVEGKKYPYKKDIVGDGHYYAEKEDVKEIIKKLGAKGEANFEAAYFMGHVELIGLGAWKKDRDKDADTFIAPVDGFSLAEVAKRCNVSEKSVADDNGKKIGDTVGAGTRLTVKGVRHHIAIDGDTYAVIAAQHGVTDASVKQANPVVAAPYPGADLVIPVH